MGKRAFVNKLRIPMGKSELVKALTSRQISPSREVIAEVIDGVLVRPHPGSDRCRI